MQCPNCGRSFSLRSDYAEHLRACRPALVGEPAVSDALLARLNAAAARLQGEFGDAYAAPATVAGLIPAA